MLLPTRVSPSKSSMSCCRFLVAICCLLCEVRLKTGLFSARVRVLVEPQQPRTIEFLRGHSRFQLPSPKSLQ